MTGLLARVTNEESVKLSIKNLILTRPNSRFYRPLVGSKINSLLFDPMDQITESSLKTAITSTIRNYEPRCNLQEVIIQPNYATQVYRVTIIFSLINIPDKTFALPITLIKVR